MVKKLQKVISYRCFECGEYQEERLILSDLKRGEGATCSSCKCHSFDISQHNKSYKLDIQCNKCGKKHYKQLPVSAFWSDTQFALTCEDCGYMICSIGNHKEDLIPLKTETYRKSSSNEIAASDMVMQAFWILQKLVITGNISCACESSSVKINFKDNGVEVNCINCEGKKFFKVESYYDLVKLKNINKIELEKKTAKIIQFINN